MNVQYFHLSIQLLCDHVQVNACVHQSHMSISLEYQSISVSVGSHSYLRSSPIIHVRFRSSAFLVAIRQSFQSRLWARKGRWNKSEREEKKWGAVISERIELYVNYCMLEPLTWSFIMQDGPFQSDMKVLQAGENLQESISKESANSRECIAYHLTYSTVCFQLSTFDSSPSDISSSLSALSVSLDSELELPCSASFASSWSSFG